MAFFTLPGYYTCPQMFFLAHSDGMAAVFLHLKMMFNLLLNKVNDAQGAHNYVQAELG